MASKTADPAAMAGSGNLSSIGVGDGSESKPREHAPQEATAALQRDFIAEALRVASIKALHAAEDITLGDDGCAECGIPIAIQNLREAATAFRRLQKHDGARSALRRQEDSRPHEHQVLLAVERSERQALAAFMQENRP